MSDKPLLYGITHDTSGKLNKTTLYLVASVLAFVVYAYLVRKFVAVDDRAEYLKRDLMTNAGIYGTGRAMDAGVGYLTGAY